MALSNRESLAAALERFTTNWGSGDFRLIATAARERLTQLDDNAIVIQKEWTGLAEPEWSAETVKRIAEALQDLSLYSQDPATGGIAGFDPQRVAVAILDALNAEIEAVA